MSDATTPGSPEPRRMAGVATGVQEDAAEVARQAKQEAAETGSRLKQEAAGAVADVKEAAGEVVSAAGDRATALLDAQREAGAAQGRAIAGAAHRAADQFAEVSPALARTMHDAAEALDGVTRSLAERSPGEMLREVEAYARRQPTVFFGAAALAGFALVRFARSSAHHPGHSVHGDAGVAARFGEPGARPAAVGRAPGWVTDPSRPADDHLAAGAAPTARPATMAAATLGGAAAMRGAPPPGGGAGAQGASTGAMGGYGAPSGAPGGHDAASEAPSAHAAPSSGQGAPAPGSRPGAAPSPGLDPATRPATLGAPPDGPL